MRFASPSSSAVGRMACLLASAAAIATFAGCGDDEDAGSGGGASTEQTDGATSGGGTDEGSADEGSTQTASADGAQVFKDSCVSCHTLAAADAKGRLGPNLDQVKPDAATVKQYVTEGEGSMPAFQGRLSADQIQAVADYVAEVAGQ